MLGVLGAISYDPIVKVDLGPLSISPHGAGIAVGFLAGAWLVLPAARERGISDDTFYSLLTRAAIGAFIGARVAYVVNHFSEYESLADALKVWEGGISLLGGIFGGALFVLPRMRALRLSFWKCLDAAAPGLALGIVIGRIGDLIVADHLGKATDFFLGYRCPTVDGVIDFTATASPCEAAVVHQTALYDLISTVVLLGVLLWLRKRPRWDGFLILFFATWYGSVRIIEDFLREDLRRFGLTGSQWTSVVTVALCLFVLLVGRRTPRIGQWDRRPPDGEDRDQEPPETEGALSGSADRRDPGATGDRDGAD